MPANRLPRKTLTFLSDLSDYPERSQLRAAILKAIRDPQIVDTQSLQELRTHRYSGMFISSCKLRFDTHTVEIALHKQNIRGLGGNACFWPPLPYQPERIAVYVAILICRGRRAPKPRYFVYSKDEIFPTIPNEPSTEQSEQ